MFLGFFKRKALKKIVTKGLPKVNTSSKNKVKTVGLLIDGTRFVHIDKLVNELVNLGLDKKNIKVLVYLDKKSKDTTWRYFYLKDINLTKKTTQMGQEVKAFENEPFDLLVNYYPQKQIALTYLGRQSKADFKVGFAPEEKQINDLVIDLPLADYQLFTKELYKYLKLFNKL